MASAAVFLLLLALTGFGIWHGHVFGQQLWEPDGLRRFLLFAGFYWPVALLLPPRWLGGVAAAFVLGYSMWWCGPIAPLAVLFLFGSAFLLGKRWWPAIDSPTAAVAGIAVIILVLWIALHFPINRPWVYAGFLLMPWLAEARRLPEYFSSFRFSCDSRKESAALALLLFALMAHWLVALKPEVSSDGLAMHLAFPMTVADQARWPFDFKQQTWAVMPNGGDSLYTAAYLLGGESGARLANFAMLLLIVSLITIAARRWLNVWQALLTAALFASTPLVQLVTGSLFVENVWAALVITAMLALARFWESGEEREVLLSGILLGASLAVKLQACVFLLPAAVLGGIACWRQKKRKPFVVAAALIVVFGAPIYTYAFAKTGNPIFPFANTRFRSPYYDTVNAFSDPRFNAPLSWKTPYDLTFHSNLYFESQPGGSGFQFLLLLLPAFVGLRKRFAWLLAAAGASACLVLLIVLPNWRYLYPGLALVSVAIGNLLLDWPVAGAVAMAAVTVLNLYFLPASGWYHRDFAYFRGGQAQQYLEHAAPLRLVIAELNRTAPGEPVAFFTGDTIAGLKGLAYTNTWHNELYWQRVRNAHSPKEIAEVLKGLNIRTIVAPVSFEAPFPVIRDFFHQWLENSGFEREGIGIFHLRDAPELFETPVGPFPPGEWDDLDERITYTGRWLHDRQFERSRGQSLTYSGDAGDRFTFKFTGSKLTYIYTKAPNRGRALVRIDGRPVRRIEMYSPGIEWQTRSVFAGLKPGTHTFEVQILSEKDPRSAGRAVDVDGIMIE